MVVVEHVLDVWWTGGNRLPKWK